MCTDSQRNIKMQHVATNNAPFIWTDGWWEGLICQVREGKFTIFSHKKTKVGSKEKEFEGRLYWSYFWPWTQNIDLFMWLSSCWSFCLFTEVSSPQSLWVWVCRHGLSWIKKIWNGELPSAEQFGLRRGLRCIWWSSICSDGGAWEWCCCQRGKRVSIAAGQETRQLSFGRHFIFCIMKPTYTSSRASLHSGFHSGGRRAISSGVSIHAFMLESNKTSIPRKRRQKNLTV